MDRELVCRRDIESKLAAVSDKGNSTLNLLEHKAEEYLSQINYLREIDRDNKELLERARKTIEVKDCTIMDLK